MKIVAIIPARYDSSRFKGKPLKLIGNKPMVQWVYERIIKSVSIDNIYVATDNDKIKNTVIGFGGNAIMTSSFHKSGTDRVAEAANFLGLDGNDLIINVQGDQPLVDARCLDNLIAPFLSDKYCEMSTLAFPIKNTEEINNSRDVKVIFDSKSYAIYFSRCNIPYCRDPDTQFLAHKHLGLYAYRKSFLEIFHKLPIGRLENIEKLEQLRPIEHGYRIFVSVTPYDSPEVDIPEDIEKIGKRIGNQF